MNEQIRSREAIAQDADMAAQRAVFTGLEQPNPHPNGSDAAAAWKASYERSLQWHSAPEAEGGA